MNVPKLRFKEFNDEWRKYKVEEILKISNGINKGKEFFGSGTPIINYMDVNKNELISHNIVKGLVIANSKELETFNVKKGDILFTRTSETSDEIGLSSSVIENIDKCIFSGFILKGTQTKNFIHHYFGGYYFRNPKMRKEIIKHSSITTRALTSGSLLAQMSISIPTIIEQEKIGKTLSLLDKKIELQNKKIEDLKLFKLCNYDNLFSNQTHEVQLKNISKIEKGKQLNNELLIENGSYYMLNGGVSPSGYTNEYNTNENTITISEGGSSCGYVNFNKNKFWCGGHCYKVIPNGINNNYLYHNLKYNEKKIMDLRVGSGLPNIQKKDIENFKISIHNENEQLKISNYFDKYDLKILLEENKLNKLIELKKGLMQNMFV